MDLLFLDTSGSTCGVAVSSGKKILAETVLRQDRKVSMRLLSIIDDLLGSCARTLSDIDGFGVTVGPGSFTGVRVGVATVKGLSLVTGKPVAAVSSLAVLASSIAVSGATVCPMMDARKKEVYTALYEVQGGFPAPVVPECVVKATDFAAMIESPTIFVGDGATAYRAAIEDALGSLALFLPEQFEFLRPAAGAVLATSLLEQGKAVDISLLAPAYIRPSEAELAKVSRTAL